MARQYLVSKGISGDRLTVVGKGSAELKSSEGTAAGMAKNRRVTFKVSE